MNKNSIVMDSDASEVDRVLAGAIHLYRIFNAFLS